MEIRGQKHSLNSQVVESARAKKRELTGAGTARLSEAHQWSLTLGGSSALRCLFDIPEQDFALLRTLLNLEPLEDLERAQGLRC